LGYEMMLPNLTPPTQSQRERDRERERERVREREIEREALDTTACLSVRGRRQIRSKSETDEQTQHITGRIENKGL
jgi:hypothetical protein